MICDQIPIAAETEIFFFRLRFFHGGRGFLNSRHMFFFNVDNVGVVIVSAGFFFEFFGKNFHSVVLWGFVFRLIYREHTEYIFIADLGLFRLFSFSCGSLLNRRERLRYIVDNGRLFLDFRRSFFFCCRRGNCKLRKKIIVIIRGFRSGFLCWLLDSELREEIVFLLRFFLRRFWFLYCKFREFFVHCIFRKRRSSLDRLRFGFWNRLGFWLLTCYPCCGIAKRNDSLVAESSLYAQLFLF